jgi:hypothetical protein
MREYREWYTIQIGDEITECGGCGCPLSVGDRALMDEKMVQAYCCEVCSDKARLRLRRIVAKLRAGRNGL